MYSLPADRMATWSNAGVWYGGVHGIPTFPVGLTVNTTDPANAYYCDPTGAVDCSAKLNAALNACPSGQAVFLPKGIYRVGASSITMPTTRVLRGAGPRNDGNGNGTRIINYSNVHCIRSSYTQGSGYSSITSGATKGSTTIVVAGGTWAVNDLVRISELNDSSIPVSQHDPGGGRTCSWCGIYGEEDGAGSRCQSETRLITAYNSGTNTITIEFPLMRDYVLTPKLHRLAVNTRKHMGIENLSVRFADGQSGGGENTDDCIYFQRAAHCWVKNCDVSKFPGMGIGFVNWGTNHQVEGCFIHNTTGDHASGSSHGIDGYTYGAENALILNNVFDDLSVAYESQGGNAGTVIAYNYVYSLWFNSNGGKWMLYDMSYHGAHPHHDLFEGNSLGKITFDEYWGSGSHDTIFRNHVTGDCHCPYGLTMNRMAIEINRNQNYHSVVGNVVGQSGGTYTSKDWIDGSGSGVFPLYAIGRSYNGLAGPTDPKVTATTIRHGNYDYYSHAIEWNGADDHTLPASLVVSSKPSWFGTLNWPPIGPDVPGYVTDIPAKYRWDQYKATGNLDYLFTEEVTPITGFTNTDVGSLIISNNEVSKLYVDTPKKRAVVGTSVVYSVHAWPWEDFTGNITLDISGLPAGATDSYSVNPITYNGSSLVTVTTTGVAAGNYDMYITGTSAGGDVASVRILLDIVDSADADLKIPFKHLRAKKGDSAVFTVQADSLPGYTSNIDLSVSGVPSGATATFANDPLAYNGKTTLTINTGTAAVGSYEITVTGEGPV
jgi:hypothetical protein